jgi:formate hydrogenlyase subunit 4
MAWESLIGIGAALILSPLLSSIIVRTKALFAGRRGMPLLQPYRDLAKLLRKGSVYSRTTTAVFRLGPVVALSATLVALVMVPMAGIGAPVAFQGDLILVVCLLGTARFFTVLAALDTGSAFEGMGASREVQFSALAEPALFLALAATTHISGAWSLSETSRILGEQSIATWSLGLPLVGVTLFVVMLAENARIPVDDPATHLELTMIHEVMVLDHSGPDLGLIGYQAGLKLWIFAALLVSLVLPIRTGHALLDGLIWASCLIGVAVAVGVVESVMARLRLIHVPRLLVGAGVLSMTALFLA